MEAGPGWLLGHTRLSIIDTSSLGRQPMGDDEGNWLAYNGEIYNFAELREELEAEGVLFRSHSDTEVLLHALRVWGEVTLTRLRGMFAFAWINTHQHRLLLARDRFGVKPLSYEVRDGELRFASDLFALRALPDASLAIDATALELYLALGYVPSPYTILRGVQKVRPGHLVTAHWAQGGIANVEERPFWEITEIPPAGSMSNKSAGTNDHYEALVEQAVRYRLVSDVEVGTLLSGGIDSTLVSLIARNLTKGDIRSFTLGMENPIFDESCFAGPVAKHLRIPNTVFQMGEASPEHFFNDIWRIYDEPFSDTSLLPTIDLCRQVAQEVKVVLSGDGGDESFAGYYWHQSLDYLNRYNVIPYHLRRLMGWMVPHIRPASARTAYQISRRTRLDQWIAIRTGINRPDFPPPPLERVQDWDNTRAFLQPWEGKLAGVTDPLDWACRLDLSIYMPDNLMVKIDRASMAFGLEVREPLLDHDLIAWSLQLPMNLRYDRRLRRSKLPSRRLLAHEIPKALLERPKQGFVPDLEGWLAGPMVQMVQEIKEKLARGDMAPLVLPNGFRQWEDYGSHMDFGGQGLLWRIVCFAGWLEFHKGYRNVG